MPDLDAYLRLVKARIVEEYKLSRQRSEVIRDILMDRDEQELQDRLLAEQVAETRSQVRHLFEQILAFPPCHVGHHARLEAFHQEAEYDKSVFVMTKYPRDDPEHHDDSDRALLAVIQAVRNAIEGVGYRARLASDHDYADTIWGNVETYLLGSKRSVAIVEDRYVKELNPNVMMEWGWMRGLGRDVLYLVENAFSEERADVAGFIAKRFDWDDPGPDIDRHVRAWLA